MDRYYLSERALMCLCPQIFTELVGGNALMSNPSYPGDHSRLAPPDPIPNSAVKRMSADDSVEFLHVKVGHRQGFISNTRCQE